MIKKIIKALRSRYFLVFYRTSDDKMGFAEVITVGTYINKEILIKQILESMPLTTISDLLKDSLREATITNIIELSRKDFKTFVAKDLEKEETD